ncbi:MAG TPA: MBL fold metallo-hydrolase [Gammaproteobacteria bacterium]|nr:MBL fold metallo-hydrolase [Gammaproteobacteria bacterium]
MGMPTQQRFSRLFGCLTLFMMLSPSALAGTKANLHSCSKTGVQLQILGSGGPELGDRRASSSYLVWLDGRARVLIDVGGGSSLNFGRSGAKMEDLDVILFSHFHVDHSADLPALIKSSFFDDRQRDLPVYGPSGSPWMPDTEDFLESLFGIEGAFRYLSPFLDEGRSNGYRLSAKVLDVDKRTIQQAFANERITTTAIAVHHGPLPALAWRVELAGKSIVFSGDMNGDYRTLPLLAKNADLLLAHNAVPEGARGVERKLHMPPTVIGEIAGQARVKQLVLSHRMKRTLGKEQQTQDNIRKHYHGPFLFADDLQCITP